MGHKVNWGGSLTNTLGGRPGAMMHIVSAHYRFSKIYIPFYGQGLTAST